MPQDGLASPTWDFNMRAHDCKWAHSIDTAYTRIHCTLHAIPFRVRYVLPQLGNVQLWAAICRSMSVLSQGDPYHCYMLVFSEMVGWRLAKVSKSQQQWPHAHVYNLL